MKKRKYKKLLNPYKVTVLALILIVLAISLIVLTTPQKIQVKPAPVVEHIDEFTTTITEGNKKTAAISLAPKNYKSANGSFEPINTNFKIQEKNIDNEKYDIVNEQGLYKTYAKQAKPELIFQYGNSKVEFAVEAINNNVKNRNDAKVKNNIIVYENIYDGIDIKYTYLPETLKEEIILKEKISGNLAIKQSLNYDGDIFLNGELWNSSRAETQDTIWLGNRMKVLSAFAEDAKETIVPATYIIEREPLTLTIFISEQQLSSLAYPLLIDPSISVNITNPNIDDAFVDQGPDTLNFGSNTQLIFRKNPANNTNIRSYIKFNLTEKIAREAEEVTSAFFEMEKHNSQTATINISLHEVFRSSIDWLESGITWNNQPCGQSSSSFNASCNNTFLDARVFTGTTGQRINFTVTKLANDSLQTRNAQFGVFSFLLNLSTTSTIDTNFTFDSSDTSDTDDGPQLYITYTINPPRINFTDPTPANNTNLSSNFIYVNTTISDSSAGGNITSYIDFNKSLVLYFNLSNSTMDLSTYGNNGTSKTNVSCSLGLLGKFGGACDFTDNGWINISNSASLNLTENFTIEAWINSAGNNYTSNQFNHTNVTAYWRFQIVGNRIYYAFLAQNITDSRYHLWTATSNIDDTNLTLAQRTRTPQVNSTTAQCGATSRSCMPSMQVVGDKIYYTFVAQNITHNNTNLWHAQMNIDGTGFTATQLTRRPEIGNPTAATSLGVYDVRFQVAGSKIYYSFIATNSTNDYNLWTASSDLDGTGFSATQRTDGSFNASSTIANRGKIQVIGDEVYYLFVATNASSNIAYGWLAKVNTNGSNFTFLQNISASNHMYMQVAGSKIYYVYDKNNSITSIPQIWTAESNIDGSIFLETQRTNITGVAGTGYSWPSLQVIGSKIFLLYETTNRFSAVGNITTAEMNLNGSGYTEKLRVYRDETVDIGILTPQLQVIGNKIYLVYSRDFTAKTVFIDFMGSSIIRKGDAYGITIDEDGRLSAFVNGGKDQIYHAGYNLSSTGTTAFGTISSGFNHIAMVYNQTNISLYINGNFINSSINNGSAYTNPFPLMIGDDIYPGLIDEVRIWQRALSEDEINASANSRPLFRNFTGLGIGNYSFYACATDEGGSQNCTETRQFNVIPPDVCGILNASKTLTNNVSSTGTCFVLNANDITLDCNNYKVQYAKVISGRGVEASDMTGLTVKNCIFEAHNVNTTNNQAVKFTRTNNSLALANTIYTNGTTNNYGIYITTKSYSNSIINNTVYTNGTGGSNYGITLQSAFDNNTVHNNTIYTRGIGASNYGIYLTLSGYKNNITQNVVYTNGSDQDQGILLSIQINNSYIFNNTIQTNSTGSNSHGIILSTDAYANTILNNTIRTYCTSTCIGINLQTKAKSNLISGNNITTDGTGASNFGIQVKDVGDGNNLTHNIIYTNGTDDNAGIYLTLSVNNTLVLNNTVDSNNTAGSSIGIYLFAQENSNKIINNTVKVYGTSGNVKGIGLRGDNNENNTFDGNNVTTNGNKSTNANRGIFIEQGSYGNNVTNNVIWVNGTGGNDGIFIDGGSNHFILNNTIRTNGTGGGVSSNDGIQINSPVSSVKIINNTIVTDGAGNTNAGVTLSGENHTVNGNNITTNGVNQNDGVRLGDYGNNVTNNIIYANGASQVRGILLLNANKSYVSNNTLVSSGTDSSNNGIYLFPNSNNNTIVNNTISTSGTSSNYGINLDTRSNNNVFDSNNITTSGGTDSYAVNILTSNSSIFNNTILHMPNQWITTGANTNNTFYNTTFFSFNGSIRYNGSFYLDYAETVDVNELNVTYNRSFLNSTNIQRLNISAIISLTGITFSDPRPVVDYQDDNSYESCSSPQCEEISFSGSTFVFSVASFTSYSSRETDVCGILNASKTLSNDISSTGTCFVLNANDITLDCNNYKVQYAKVISGRGVEASDKTGLTVKNCVFEAHNVNTTNNQAIKFTRTNNSLALANIIYTNGTTNNYGIYITTKSYSNSIINNTVYTNGTGGTNIGITLQSTFENNTVHNNTIYTQGNGSANSGIDLASSGYKNNITQNIVYTNGTQGNVGILLSNSVNNSFIYNNTIQTNGTSNQNKGIQLNTRNSNNRITNNTIRTNGVGDNYGIDLRIGSDNNTIEGNNITTSGGKKNYGIVINIGFGNNITNNFIIANGTNTNIGILLYTHSNYTTVLNNTIIADGNETSNTGIDLGGAQNNTLINNSIIAIGASNSHGITLVSSSGNIFDSNNITTSVSTSYAIQITTSNSTIFNNTIIHLPNQWITIGVNTNNTFYNTTFQSFNGSIRYNGSFYIDRGETITIAKLNVTYNRSFVNSTNLTWFNTSAFITLSGITFSDPRPVVDYQDDNSYESCSSPQCDEISFSGNTFVFSVASFTSYSSRETDKCGILNSSLTLTNDISSTGMCFVINANDITLDCNGYLIQYAKVVTGIGVDATGKSGFTVKNCRMEAHNRNKTSNYGIRLTASNSSFLLNNTIFTNGTSDNVGIKITTKSYNNSVVNNTINTSGTAGSNYGIYILTTAAGNNITHNVISANGTTDNDGIVLWTSVSGTLVWNNTIKTNGTSSDNYGIWLVTQVTNTNVLNNTIITDGTQYNDGIRIEDNSHNSTVSDNNITAHGYAQSQGDTGIDSISSHNNTIKNNKILAIGEAATYGIDSTRSNGTVILNNTINVTVPGMGNGGRGISATNSHSNTIANNTIFLTGGDTGTGIGLFTTSENNRVESNNITVVANESDARGIGIQTKHNVVIGNILFVNGTNSNDGIFISADNNTVNNNTVQVYGNESENTGVLVSLNGNNNTVTNNTIVVGVTDSNNGIRLQFGAGNNTFIGNNITTSGASSYAINLTISAGNVFNHTILNNPVQWIITNSSANATFENTTFVSRNSTMEFGKIIIQAPFRLDGTVWDITQQKLNTTYNRSFVNSTNLTRLNVTSVVVLNLQNSGLTPIALLSSNDNTFAECPASICTGETFTDNIFTFLVSQWTSYAAGNDTFAPAVAIQSPPNATNSSSTIVLNYTAGDGGGSGISQCIREWTNQSGAVYNKTMPSCANESWTGSDGSHTIRIWVNDTSNNKAVATVTFTIDSQIEIIINDPTNTTFSSLNRSVNFRHSNFADTCSYELNGANTTLFGCNNATFLAAEGLNQIILWINNTANVLNYSSRVWFTTDTIAPFVNITNPLNITYNLSVVYLNYSASDVNRDQCIRELNGINTTLTTCQNQTLDESVLGEQSHKIIIWVNDSAGNVNYSVANFTFRHIIIGNVTVNRTGIPIPHYNQTENINASVWAYWDNNTRIGNITTFIWNDTNGNIVRQINFTNNANGFASDNFTTNTSSVTGVWWVKSIIWVRQNGTVRSSENQTAFRITELHKTNITLQRPTANELFINWFFYVNYTIGNNSDASCTLSVNNTNTTLATCQNRTFDETTLSDGSYSIIVFTNTSNAQNNSGAVSASFRHNMNLSLAVNTTSANQGANINITTGNATWENGTTIRMNVQINWTKPDGSLARQINFSTNSTNGQYWDNFTTNSSSQTGTWTVFVAQWVYQNATIRMQTNRTTFTLSDVTGPTVTIQNPSNATYIVANVTLNYTVNDNTAVSQCVISLNGVNTSYPACSNVTYTEAHLGEGSHTIIVWANDSSNNKGQSSIGFTFRHNMNLSLAINDSTANQGANINISTGNATWENGTTIRMNVQINWTKPDGSLARFVNFSTNSTNGQYWDNFTTNSTSETGTWTVFVVQWVYQNSSIRSQTNRTTFVLNDNVGPTITIQNPSNATYIVANVTLNYTVNDNTAVSQCVISLNGVNTSYPACSNVTYTEAHLGEGSHTIIVWANDSSNNRGQSSIGFTFRHNMNLSLAVNDTNANQGANINITTGNATWENGTTIRMNVQINWTKPDGTLARTINFSTNSTNGQYWDNFTTNSSSQTGTWTVFVVQWVYQNATIRMQTNRTTFTLSDVTGPTVTIQNPSNATYIVANVTLNYTVNDNTAVSQCVISLNGVNTSYPACSNVTYTEAHLGEGSHTIIVWANDSSNNRGQSNVSFTFRHTLIANVTTDKLSYNASEDVNASGVFRWDNLTTIQGAAFNVTIRWLKPDNTTVRQINFTPTSVGRFWDNLTLPSDALTGTWRVNVTGFALQNGTARTMTNITSFEVNGTTPPNVTNLTQTPSFGLPGTNFVFNATLDDQDDGLANYTFSWNGTPRLLQTLGETNFGNQVDPFGKCTMVADDFTPKVTGYVTNITVQLQNMTTSTSVYVEIWSAAPNQRPKARIESAYVNATLNGKNTYRLILNNTIVVQKNIKYFVVLNGSEASSTTAFRNFYRVRAASFKSFKSTNCGTTWTQISNRGPNIQVHISEFNWTNDSSVIVTGVRNFSVTNKTAHWKGSFGWYVCANNTDGAKGCSEAKILSVINNTDGIPPVATFFSPTNNSIINGNVTLKSFVTDPNGVAYVEYYYSENSTNNWLFYSNASNPTGNEWHAKWITINFNNASHFNWRAFAVDTKGNAVNGSHFNFSIDRNVPIVNGTFVIYPNSSINWSGYGKNITIKANVSDPLPGTGMANVTVNLSYINFTGFGFMLLESGSKDAGEWSIWKSDNDVHMNVSAAELLVQLNVTDNATPLRNSFLYEVFTIRLDSISPTTVDCSRNGSLVVNVGEDINFACTFADNLSGLKDCRMSHNFSASWKNETWIGITGIEDTCAQNYTFPSAGQFAWFFWANDSVDNANNSQSFNITVINAPEFNEPFVEILWYPNNSFVNRSTFNVTYNVTDASAITECVLFVDADINATNQTPVSKGVPQYLQATAVEDGWHDFYVVCEDEWFNINISSIFNYTIDSIAPPLTLDEPKNVTYNLSIVTLNFTTGDLYLDQCIRELNGINTTIANCQNQTLDESVLGEQSHKIIVWVNDSAGNINYSVANFTFRHNMNLTLALNASSINQSANINITTGNATWENGTTIRMNVQINWTKPDGTLARTINFSTNSTNGQYWDNFTTNSSSQTGTWTVFVVQWVYQNSTLRSQTNRTTFTLNDITGPSVSIQSPPNATNSTNTIVLNYTASDNSGISACVREWTNQTGAVYNKTMPSCANESWTGSDGSHTIRIWVNDTSNNKAVAVVSFTIDTIYPNATIVVPQNNSAHNDTTGLNFTVRDSNKVDQCKYELDGVNYSLPTCQNITLYDLNEGNHSVKIWVNDSAGNTNSSEPIFFNITAPVPNVTFVPPTEINDTVIGRDYMHANVTVNLNSSQAWLELNGVNYSMTNLTANGSAWFINKTNLVDDVYTFRVWVRTTRNAYAVTETRIVTLDTSTQVSFKWRINVTSATTVDNKGFGYYTSSNLTNYYTCTEDRLTNGIPTFSIIPVGLFNSIQFTSDNTTTVAQNYAGNSFVLAITQRGCNETIVPQLPSEEPTKPFISTGEADDAIEVLIKYPNIDIVTDIDRVGSFKLIIEKNDTDENKLVIRGV